MLEISRGEFEAIFSVKLMRKCGKKSTWDWQERGEHVAEVKT